ncbi:cytochrome c biogenesis heme-transporting ATPase CcmA [Marinomonas sp. 15G1-11]|uniref:Cytochrome c biogenesis heme-transporting ATPase CcmA n=1 Tax=Marinomonas phaeophyticola TaxID=3004091 RepID=A0ABT4JY40_9GAMM|nr:cytochrome c biogenesis heme-transporting ATPase CcmA [Marinomonas sp. 15G1-11]MCZ2723321.1 cytochrome c biogenesis heme-transporting ATPase CcmA [Marinomonas sp. 15G1-11]
MHSSISLNISNLWIERGERYLCKDMSFSLSGGDICKINGENGAGKSTLLKIIVGILSPLEGTVYYNGEDVSIHRDLLHQDVLYLGHNSAIKSVFSVAENLRWYFPNASDEAIAYALSVVSLSGYEETPSSQLSAGQKRRITLARLWLTDKPLWLLDEPFTALDVQGVSSLEKRMRDHISNGGLIILTTHQDIDASLNVKEINLTL